MEGWIDIPQPYGEIFVGNDVRFCRGVELSVPAGGVLEILPGCMIGRGCLISAHGRITLGSGTMLAEFVCIHDNDHRTDDLGRPIADQGFAVDEVFVGEGSWIGAKAVLLRGTVLGAGTVVGAQSVVKGRVPARSVVVGVPGRVRRVRGG